MTAAAHGFTEASRADCPPSAETDDMDKRKRMTDIKQTRRQQLEDEVVRWRREAAAAWKALHDALDGLVVLHRGFEMYLYRTPRCDGEDAVGDGAADGERESHEDMQGSWMAFVDAEGMVMGDGSSPEEALDRCADAKETAETTDRVGDPRFAICICPGCGWTGLRRPLEESDDNAAESFCDNCGYEVNAPPWRLPSIAELKAGQVPGDPWDVNLRAFIPALLQALALSEEGSDAA
jgi:hypothetical protein